MQFGISSTEVKTVAEFLLQHSLLDDNPKYEEGYQQAVKDMEELLSEKVMQNMKAMAEELDKINEPKKAVIPQSVADWLEVCKENLAISLFFAMTPDVLEVNNQSAETIYWLKSARNQETFAKAWLYGYEVEKEKLYTVKFSNEDFGKTYIGIIKTANKIGISTVPINDECSKCYFTKSELEEFKFWNNPAFEFEEVEE